MRRPRLVGLIVSLATAGTMLAAPALAAGQVTVPLTFDAQVFLAAGATLPQTQSYSKCWTGVAPQTETGPDGKTINGATFGGSHAVNSQGAPFGQSFTPAGGSVSFQFPPQAGNNALCIASGQTVTIPVPAGNYTAADFLVGAGNGPGAVTVTPVYGSTNGAAIPAIFDDWCGNTAQVKGTFTAGTTAGWPGPNGGGRVNTSTGKTEGTVTGSTQATLPCGFNTTAVTGLDSTQVLTALQVTMAAGGAPVVPADPAIKAGTTQSNNAMSNIAALTLLGTASAAASSTSALPKTGGNQLGIVLGSVLLLLGAALAIRPRFGRAGR